ncbi:Maf family protein [Aristophania vespae]|uniref:Maf family protein n=1 Tax=Aristophania vespae TaxID=2697033 RepID=UPI002351508E|nr:nucleoside triphosphate pyrophosphatase [Aristophania vespae]UMM64045.1 dTTP/UTP pyrophosphatase [Aristophania vespae]
MFLPLRKPFILASGSKIRREILQHAGISPDIKPVDLDEEAIRQEAISKGASPQEIAMRLAQEKAYEAAAQLSHDHVILAADQILELDGKIFSKPLSLEEAAGHLRALRGKTHNLQTALVLHAEGKIIWRHVSTPKLTMRLFSESFLKHYLDVEGHEVLQSVGAYRIEALGVHLFSHIEGDRDAILGLPLLPLLSALRQHHILSDDFS